MTRDELYSPVIACTKCGHNWPANSTAASHVCETPPTEGTEPCHCARIAENKFRHMDDCPHAPASPLVERMAKRGTMSELLEAKDAEIKSLVGAQAIRARVIREQRAEIERLKDEWKQEQGAVVAAAAKVEAAEKALREILKPRPFLTPRAVLSVVHEIAEAYFKEQGQ